MWKRWTLKGVAAAAVVAMCSAPADAAARDGDLDPSFSKDGKRLLAPGNATDVVVDDRGRAVISLGFGPAATAIRLTKTGAVDRTFGQDGAARVEFGPNDESAAALEPVPDGGYYVVGSASSGDTEGLLGVGRLTSDGAPDPAFGSAGVVTHSFGRLVGVHDAALGVDGKLTITGRFWQDGTDTWFVARLNADGGLDTSFSSDGWTTIELGIETEGLEIGFDGAGRTYASGEIRNPSTRAELWLVRLLDDGSLDQTFSGDGSVRVSTVTAALGTGLLVAANGDILLAGTGGGDLADFAVTRLSPGGEPVTSFGSQGLALMPLDDNYNTARWLGFDDDSRLLAVGGTLKNAAVVRLSDAGSPDRRFGADGVVLTPFGRVASYSMASATAAAFGPGERLTVVGRSGTHATAVARYLMHDPGPRDRDADGFVDSRDLCVDMYGPDHGCRTFGAQVSIEYNGRKFRGRVSEENVSCDELVDRTVRVYRERPGPDRLIGSSDLGYPSQWSVNAINRDRGVYYAVAMPARNAVLGICAKARSPRLTLPDDRGRR